MLKLRHRNEWRGKCPRHPNQQYGDPGALPASCRICEALWRVWRVDWKLTQEQERALVLMELAKPKRGVCA